LVTRTRNANQGKGVGGIRRLGLGTSDAAETMIDVNLL